MPKTTLLMVFHNHQPTGNLDSVFSATAEDCYAPLIDCIYKFPSLKFTLHFTGPLWNWIEENQPEIFDKLQKMVSRGQVEIMGGGFYEPMLAVLPENDAIGQLKMMKDRIKKRFKVESRGMWTAERVWEPDLARIIARGGYEYTLLDDSHFHSAGLSGELDGYYVTEKAGETLSIFPISQSLRYAIPFKDPQEVIDQINQLSSNIGEDNVILTYGDDGEKFGVWPGTKDLVWNRKWLENFFLLLEQNSEDIQTATPSQVLDTRSPKGTIYLPTASYEEMGEWALKPAAQESYKLTHSVIERFISSADTIKRKHHYVELIAPILDSLDKLPVEWLERYLKLMENGGLFLLAGSRKILGKFDEKVEALKKLNSLASMIERLHPMLKGSNILLNITGEINKLLDDSLEIVNLVGQDPSRLKSFVNGGIWQGFLSKYHESNLIHKRMLMVSSRLQKLETEKAGIDNALLVRAKDHLYQAQCNCAYWHGIFGGLYMVHLRHALYYELLKAEYLMDRYDDVTSDTISVIDYDMDLSKEVIFNGPEICAIVKPQMGGSLLEFDIKSRYFNITNVKTREEEGYHKDLQIRSADDEQVETATIHHHVDYVDNSMMEKKVYDFGPRTSFQDIFVDGSINPSDFVSRFNTRKFEDLGDFAHGKYEKVRVLKKSNSCSMERVGSVSQTPLKIVKKYSVSKNVLKVEYKFSLPEGGDIDVWFAPESSFSILSDSADDRRITINEISPQGNDGRSGIEKHFSNTTSAGMIDYYDGFSFNLEWSEKTDLIIYPFFSLSKSETGVELNYQGTSITPFIKLKLNNKQKKTVKLTLSSKLFPPQQ
jgi:Glycosyl hydrolase family 57/Alpha-amylase/4-alpha-glucanotransferase, C-terminal/Alpha-amylase/4-alpha-glucanotransferase, middle domain